MALIFCMAALHLNKDGSHSYKKGIQKERVIPGFDNPGTYLKVKVKELAHRQEGILRERLTLDTNTHDHHLDLTNTQFGSRVLGSDLLTSVYDRCHERFVKENDHFNFGTSFMNQQKQKAIWAIWAWGRRVDELADGVNGSFATHETFDRMEERVINIYQGRPFDIYDVALADTLTRYPVDFQLFKDLIDGTRMDLINRRFKTFDELYLYRYYCATSFFLMLIQVMGFAPESTSKMETIYDGIITLGNALTLIDGLRDIGEEQMRDTRELKHTNMKIALRNGLTNAKADAMYSKENRREELQETSKKCAKEGRIYIPQDELKLAGVSEEDIFSGIVTDKWRNLMRGQVKRARMLLDKGAESINGLDKDVRWPLWATALTYRQDLEVIEARDYDVFSKKAVAGKARRLTTLPLAYAKSLSYNHFLRFITG